MANGLQNVGYGYEGLLAGKDWTKENSEQDRETKKQPGGPQEMLGEGKKMKKRKR